MPDHEPLSLEVQCICRLVHTPPRLVAHLTLVHDVAFQLLAGIRQAFPEIDLDTDSILFGAGTHDIGKAICPEERTGPGKTHEIIGRNLLNKLEVRGREQDLLSLMEIG